MFFVEPTSHCEQWERVSIVSHTPLLPPQLPLLPFLLHFVAYHRLCTLPCRDWLWWCHHYLLQPNWLMKTELPTRLTTHWEWKKLKTSENECAQDSVEGEVKKKIWVTADDCRWHTAFSLYSWGGLSSSFLPWSRNYLCPEMHPFNGTCLVCVWVLLRWRWQIRPMSSYKTAHTNTPVVLWPFSHFSDLFSVILLTDRGEATTKNSSAFVVSIAPAIMSAYILWRVHLYRSKGVSSLINIIICFSWRPQALVSSFIYSLYSLLR